MNKEIVGSLAWAGGIITLALGATAANKLGYVDRDTVTRLVISINGLMIAWYGNRVPKRFAPSAAIKQVQRVAGWSQVLSGLVYAGLWAFAPMNVAVWGGIAAVVAGMVVTFGYCLSLRNRAKAA
jgi:hypothetical protein